jgi:L-glyceraldehyde 3-phosphate reductase
MPVVRASSGVKACPSMKAFTKAKPVMNSATAVNSGRALYAGLSKYPLKRLKKAVKILKDMGIRCLVYQPPYSILNRWPEAEGIHEWLEEKGIGSIVFSPLAQGMLTGKYVDGIPDGSRAARSEGFLQASQVEAQLEKIRALHQLAGERGLSLQHLALRWVLDQRGVTSAIVGARTVSQLDDSLDALRAGPLDEEMLDIIDAISPAVKKDDAEA